MARQTLIVAAALAVTIPAIGSVQSADADVASQTLQLLDTGATIDVFLNGGDLSHVGDREVFRDTLVWAKDHDTAGKAEGHCTLIEPSTATTTCTIVTTLQRGTLTTEGVGAFRARPARRRLPAAPARTKAPPVTQRSSSTRAVSPP